MKLSIIVPVFNEEKTIAQVLQLLSRVQIPLVTKEIIVINDGSSDNSLKEINKYKKDSIRVINLSQNRGKGAAVSQGIKVATGDYILIQDADLEYNPNDIPFLIKPILQKKAEVVYGTRLKRLPNFFKDEKNPLFLLHFFGNRFLSFITSMLYGQWITDMETGYKLFPRKSLHGVTLSSKSFDFEPEITAHLIKKGYRITEIPIQTNPRGYSSGKKLNASKDGPIALFTLIKLRFFQ